MFILRYLLVPIAAVILLIIGVMLLLDFSKKRPVLWLLAGASVVSMGIWRGGKRLLALQGLQFRPWLYAALFIIAGLTSAAFFFWILCEIFAKEDVTLALKTAVSILGVLVLLGGGIMVTFQLIGRLQTESSGEWYGQKVVMTDGSMFYYGRNYDYYQYRGLFLMGAHLGSSDEPWGEPYWTASAWNSPNP